jgi:hypothetical protein
MEEEYMKLNTMLSWSENTVTNMANALRKIKSPTVNNKEIIKNIVENEGLTQLGQTILTIFNNYLLTYEDKNKRIIEYFNKHGIFQQYVKDDKYLIPVVDFKKETKINGHIIYELFDICCDNINAYIVFSVNNR